jgi:hypothetical protein
VALGDVLFDRVDDVEGADDVVGLGEDGMAAVDHREGRAALFAVMDDRVGLEVAHDAADERVVGQIADRNLNRLAAGFAPRGDAVLQRANRDEAFGAAFEVPKTPAEIIDDANFVAAPGQIHRLRPSEVAVPTSYNHPH